MDRKYEIVRKQLDCLGYHYPLIIDAIPLTEKLLSDLIQTTNSLRYYKNVAQTAVEERDKYQLGSEPYKCDNAKLVKECNDLHLKFIHCKEKAEKDKNEFIKQIKKLKRENSDLHSKVLSLEYESAKKNEKILELRGVKPKAKKASGTVRLESGGKMDVEGKKNENKPPCTKCSEAKEQKISDLSEEIRSLNAKCTQQSQMLDSCRDQLLNREKEIERLNRMLEGGRPVQALNKDCCYKEIDHRISQLADEISTLEIEKKNLQLQLKESVAKQHEAMKRALHLAERNNKLEKELRDIDHMALAVETECNTAVQQNSERATRIQEQLDVCEEHKRSLERENSQLKRDQQQMCSDLEASQLANVNLQRTLDTVLDDKKKLTDRINHLTIIEHDLNIEIDRLVQTSALQKRRIVELEGQILTQKASQTSSEKIEGKKSKIKEKISSTRKQSPQISPTISPIASNKSSPRKTKAKQSKTKRKSEDALDTNICSTDIRELINREREHYDCQIKDIADHCAKYHKGSATSLMNESDSAEINKLKAERDYYLREYQRLKEQMNNLPEQPETLIELRRKLNEKDQSLVSLQLENRDLARDRHNLKSRLDEMQERDRWDGVADTDGSSVKSVLRRLERERDLAKSDVQRLEDERDALRERLKMATETQVTEHSRLEKTIMESEERVRQLEVERRELMTTQGSRRATINNLEQQCEALKEQLRATHGELAHHQALYSQLKTLQEQTDRALSDSQGQLTQVETELLTAQNRVRELERDRSNLDQDVAKLQNEVVTLRGNLAQIDEEKDGLLIHVDDKTERLAMLEQELRVKENKIIDLETSLAELRKKLDITMGENGSKEYVLRGVSVDMERLRQELESALQEKNDLITENQRMKNDLSAALDDCQSANQNLLKANQTVEDLRNQLQEYIAEIKRFEDLLSRKETERDGLLEHFRNLSHDATVLENNNHTLEKEIAETKLELRLSQDKLTDAKQQLTEHELLIKGYEDQISDLTTQVASMETKLIQQKDKQHHVEAELTSMRDLCMKLDNQKDVLVEEASERDSIKLRLEREIERLRKDYKRLEETNAQYQSTIDSLEGLLAAARDETVQQKLRNKELKAELQQCRPPPADSDSPSDRYRYQRSEYGAGDRSSRRQTRFKDDDLDSDQPRQYPPKPKPNPATFRISSEYFVESWLQTSCNNHVTTEIRTPNSQQQSLRITYAHKKKSQEIIGVNNENRINSVNNANQKTKYDQCLCRNVDTQNRITSPENLTKFIYNPTSNFVSTENKAKTCICANNNRLPNTKMSKEDNRAKKVAVQSRITQNLKKPSQSRITQNLKKSSSTNKIGENRINLNLPASSVYSSKTKTAFRKNVPINRESEMSEDSLQPGSYQKNKISTPGNNLTAGSNCCAKCKNRCLCCTRRPVTTPPCRKCMNARNQALANQTPHSGSTGTGSINDKHKSDSETLRSALTVSSLEKGCLHCKKTCQKHS